MPSIFLLKGIPAGAIGIVFIVIVAFILSTVIILTVYIIVVKKKGEL